MPGIRASGWRMSRFLALRYRFKSARATSFTATWQFHLKNKQCRLAANLNTWLHFIVVALRGPSLLRRPATDANPLLYFHGVEPKSSYLLSRATAVPRTIRSRMSITEHGIPNSPHACVHNSRTTTINLNHQQRRAQVVCTIRQAVMLLPFLKLRRRDYFKIEVT